MTTDAFKQSQYNFIDLHIVINHFQMNFQDPFPGEVGADWIKELRYTVLDEQTSVLATERFSRSWKKRKSWLLS